MPDPRVSIAPEPSLALHALARPDDVPPEPLARHLPFVSEPDDRTMLLRDGDLIAALAFDGIAAATADPLDVEALAAAHSALVAQQMPDVGFTVHRISCRTAPGLDPVDAEGAGDFAAEIDRRWRRYLGVAGLRERTTVITVAIRPSRATSLLGRLRADRVAARADELARRRARLDRIVDTFSETLRAARPRRLTVSGGEWLGTLRATLGSPYAPVRPGSRFVPIADLVANAGLRFDGDQFTVLRAHAHAMRVGAILTLKDYPTATEPGLLDALNLPVDTVVTHTFTPADRVEALARIQRTARQMAASDDAAVSLRVQLEEAADNQASGRVAFGLHHATVVVHADDEHELDEAVASIVRGVTSAGGSIVREGFAARAAFFAQMPGSWSHRTRAAMISSWNFADLAALHGAPRGRPTELSPWGQAITVLPTGSGEPYRLNVHLPGERGERTVGHTLVLTQTGSGKTLGTAFLLAQAMRLAPRVIAFDKDRGLGMPVRAPGGSYTPVRMGVPAHLDPFASEADERGAAWLADWLGSILRPKDGELTPVQFEALARAAEANRHAPPNLRTLAHFRSQLRSVDDGRDLHTRLGRWDADGQHGWLFGGEGIDPLAFDSDVTAFDLTEVFDVPEVRTARLSYVFRRIERIVEDERPTLIVMDEAWRLLDDPHFRSRLKDWMPTMRKKNVAVVLLTQRVSHIAGSAAGGAILESVATQIVYPSSCNTAHELGLDPTAGEAAFLMQPAAGHRLALVRSGRDSAIVDMNLAALGPLVSVLGGGKGEGWPDGWRDDPEFWRRGREGPPRPA